MNGSYPARKFTSDTRLMKAEGKWTPEAVLIYELMKRLAEVEPHPEGIAILGGHARQLVMDTPDIPEGASLIIQVIGDDKLLISAHEPEEEE